MQDILTLDSNIRAITLEMLAHAREPLEDEWLWSAGKLHVENAIRQLLSHPGNHLLTDRLISEPTLDAFIKYLYSEMNRQESRMSSALCQLEPCNLGIAMKSLLLGLKEVQLLMHLDIFCLNSLDI